MKLQDRLNCFRKMGNEEDVEEQKDFDSTRPLGSEGDGHSMVEETLEIETSFYEQNKEQQLQPIGDEIAREDTIRIEALRMIFELKKRLGPITQEEMTLLVKVLDSQFIRKQEGPLSSTSQTETEHEDFEFLEKESPTEELRQQADELPQETVLNIETKTFSEPPLPPPNSDELNKEEIKTNKALELKEEPCNALGDKDENNSDTPSDINEHVEDSQFQIPPSAQEIKNERDPQLESIRSDPQSQHPRSEAHEREDQEEKIVLISDILATKETHTTTPQSSPEMMAIETKGTHQGSKDPQYKHGALGNECHNCKDYSPRVIYYIPYPSPQFYHQNLPIRLPNNVHMSERPRSVPPQSISSLIMPRNDIPPHSSETSNVQYDLRKTTVSTLNTTPRDAESVVRKRQDFQTSPHFVEENEKKISPPLVDAERETEPKKSIQPRDEVKKLDTFIEQPKPDQADKEPSNRPTETPTFDIASMPISLEAIQARVANVKNQKNEWLYESLKFCGNPSKKSLNFLVLGQTGVGKSTLINSFVNYMSYSTLGEALAAKMPICMIPAKFTLFTPDQFKKHEIILGNHKNEMFSEQGQSVTQDAKTYLFSGPEQDIYIIDTPGMDDSRGVKQDDENIQKILRAIAPFKELHAICFLFKPNEARFTTSFKYSIHKLLYSLNRSALSNVCFVFTNARGTFYRPGDTIEPLRAYFKEIEEKNPSLAMSISQTNTFSLDNEAFRFICAHFSGIQFTADQMKSFADSWKHSATEVKRLLSHASRLRPHNTVETLSINDVRTWIYQLFGPILDLCPIIISNCRQLEEQLKELQQVGDDAKKLSKFAAVRLAVLEVNSLPSAQIVCTNQRCVSYKEIDGRTQPIYSKVCLSNCLLPLNGKTEAENLSKCTNFSSSGWCAACGCFASDHKRLLYNQRIVPRVLENSDLLIETDVQELKKALICNLESIKEGYNGELDYMLLAMTIFSAFLAENEISQKTANIFGDYLTDLMIADFKSKNQRNESISQLSKRYREIRAHYVSQRNPGKVTIEKVQETRQKLFSMRFTGTQLAKIFAAHVEAENRGYGDEVTRCEKSTFKKLYGSAWKVTKAVLNGIFTTSGSFQPDYTNPSLGPM